MRILTLVLTSAALLGLATGAMAQPLGQAPAKPAPTEAQNVPKVVTPAPKDWIDPVTGHRVVRLSPDAGGGSLYFHQNSYLVGGGELVFTSGGKIMMTKVPSGDPSVLLDDRTARLMFTGRKSRLIYFARTLPNDGGNAYFTLDPDTRAVRQIATGVKGSIGSINADETLLLGQIQLKPAPSSAAPGYPYAKGPDGRTLTYAETREVNLNERLDAKVPMEIFTINIATGQRRVVRAATDWLNHIQFSPTDPNLIMFCHEGPWHKVDRIWTIRTDGKWLRKIHTRTMNMEIAGHEFFGPDGKTIWYDLQTPRGEKFWLASLDLVTGKRNWLHLERNEWSVHFNVSHDGKLFLGDGGDAEMVAHAPDGKYMYLFRPEPIPDVAGISAPNAASLISPGRLVPEKLVDMRRHDYRLEPNATFTPDNKWVVFGGNFHGTRHVYAVEVARAAGGQASR